MPDLPICLSLADFRDLSGACLSPAAAPGAAQFLETQVMHHGRVYPAKLIEMLCLRGLKGRPQLESSRLWAGLAPWDASLRCVRKQTAEQALLKQSGPDLTQPALCAKEAHTSSCPPGKCCQDTCASCHVLRSCQGCYLRGK